MQWRFFRKSPGTARAGGINCRKDPLQKFLNTKRAGGCGVVRFPWRGGSVPWVSVRSVGRCESFRVSPYAVGQIQQRPVMGRWLRLNGGFGFGGFWSSRLGGCTCLSARWLWLMSALSRWRWLGRRCCYGCAPPFAVPGCRPGRGFQSVG